MAEQAGRLAYAHGSAFTTEPLEAYAARGRAPPAGRRPGDLPGRRAARRRSRRRSSSPGPTTSPAARPIAGSSIARWGSYHGNTLGALDLSGRKPLRRPYEGWLGRFRHVSAAYPYRAGEPGANALGDADELAAELDAAVRGGRPGHRRRVRRRADRRRDARPPPSRPTATGRPIAEVCRRHGVLLIADEVMTGFGRTGRWFGLDHWGVRPDILVAAKGATSGYWPFGFVAASDAVHDAVTGRPPGFVHGFTYSHAPVGAAVAREVLRILERRGSLVEASAAKGERLADARSTAAFGDHPAVGEIRGRGLMVGIELVADRETREPFPRAARVTEAVVRGRARARACSSIRGPATPTASTATRSCSGRRSSSPTPSSSGSHDAASSAEADRRSPVREPIRRCASARSAPRRTGGRHRRCRRTAQDQQAAEGDQERAARCSPPNEAPAMLTPPTTTRSPPNQSCQPHPPPDGGTDGGDEQEGDAEAERAQAVGLDPRPR